MLVPQTVLDYVAHPLERLHADMPRVDDLFQAQQQLGPKFREISVIP
jgi:hypothetical protein